LYLMGINTMKSDLSVAHRNFIRILNEPALKIKSPMY